MSEKDKPGPCGDCVWFTSYQKQFGQKKTSRCRFEEAYFMPTEKVDRVALKKRKKAP